MLFNVVAVLSLRWLATAAAAGPSSLTLWVLAALFFFIPQGLAVSELAARYPDEGGIYAWTKRAFGDGHGFLCGWCYWVNNLLYYPNLLMSTAVIATFVMGRGRQRPGEQLVLRAAGDARACSGSPWRSTSSGWGPASGCRMRGRSGPSFRASCWWPSGSTPSSARRPIANDLHFRNLIPDLESFSAINLWASIAFAFAGLELSAVMAGEVMEPRKTLPRSILLAAPLILGLYVVGTIAVLALVPSGDVNIVSGFLQAINVGAANAGLALAWLAPLMAAMYVLGNVGGIGAWLAGPARVALVIGLDRYFPPAFGRIHPKWKTPWVAILVQAGLATVFLLVSVLGKGTTVQRAYLIVLDTMLLIYFIPYIYLFLAYIKFTSREPSPRPTGSSPG